MNIIEKLYCRIFQFCFKSIIPVLPYYNPKILNAILIPYVLDAYGEKIYKKLKELGIAAGVCNDDMSEKDAALKFIQSIRDLNNSMGIKEHIADLKEQDIDKLSKFASLEGNPIYPVPVLMNRKELKQFYYDVLVK